MKFSCELKVGFRRLRLMMNFAKPWILLIAWDPLSSKGFMGWTALTAIASFLIFDVVYNDFLLPRRIDVQEDSLEFCGRLRTTIVLFGDLVTVRHPAMDLGSTQLRWHVRDGKLSTPADYSDLDLLWAHLRAKAPNVVLKI